MGKLIIRKEKNMDYEQYYKKSKKIRLKYLERQFIELLDLKLKYNSINKDASNVYKVFNELQNNLILSKNEIDHIIDSALIKMNLYINENGDIVDNGKV